MTASFEPFGNHAWKLEIKLDMQPFRYQKSVEPVVLTASGTITNLGTIYSEPIIEIEGDGDVSLTIGRKTMYLAIKTKATIDCRQGKQNIYNATGAVQNTLRKRGGSWRFRLARLVFHLLEMFVKLLFDRIGGIRFDLFNKWKYTSECCLC